MREGTLGRGIRRGLVLLLLLVHGWALAQEVPSDLRLYARKRGAALRSEPNLSAVMLDALPYGTALRQLNVRGGWFEVEDASTQNKGWIQKEDTSPQNPVLEPGYGKVLWGQSLEEVAAATGAQTEGQRLVARFEQGPIAAVAYNFSKGRLWFVEERYRLPPGQGFAEVIERAQARFGRPTEENERRFQNGTVWMRAKFQHWDTGKTGFALLAYDPLEEEAPIEVRAEYWSIELAAEAGWKGGADPIAGLDFGGSQP